MIDTSCMHAAGCNTVSNTSSLLVLNTTFSQAPSTQLSFVCTSNLDQEPSLHASDQVMTTTCQESGIWAPWPDEQCNINNIIGNIIIHNIM